MKLFFQAIRIFVVLTILTGVVYPALMTLAAQTFFPRKAQGSLVVKDGKCVGSDLLAQKFQEARYFWPRPSASDYGTIPSGASNLGPTSLSLKSLIKMRSDAFRSAHDLSSETKLPAEMVFASASGLDPHISPEAALLQVERISKARGFDVSQKEKVNQLVHQYTQRPDFGFLGEARVNVFKLNLALDSL